MSFLSMSGFWLSVGIAVCAQWIHTLPFAPFTIQQSHPIDALLIALLLGMTIRYFIPELGRFQKGVRYSAKKLLPWAIVLMGAKLNFNDLIQVSTQALLISVSSVLIAFIFTLYVCKWMQVGKKLGILIGVGTAICGGTAIAVVAPTIEADEGDTAFALTTITIFGLIAIVTFPILGHILALSEADFGVWAGVSIQATPQVMAAGFAYGPQAGEIALIVKLVRVLLLAPMVMLLSAWHAKEKQKKQEVYLVESHSWTVYVPPFLLGFLLLATCHSLHLLPHLTLHLQDSILWSAGDLTVSIPKVARKMALFLVCTAMAGIGLGVHIKSLRAIGMKAMLAGFASALILAIVSLITIYLM